MTFSRVSSQGFLLRRSGRFKKLERVLTKRLRVLIILFKNVTTKMDLRIDEQARWKIFLASYTYTQECYQLSSFSFWIKFYLIFGEVAVSCNELLRIIKVFFKMA